MAIEIKYEHITVEFSGEEELKYELSYYEKDGFECCGVFNNLGAGCYTLIMKKRVS